jgi:hypothetical protein
MRSSKWSNCSRPQGEVRVASHREVLVELHVIEKDDLANQDIQPGDIETEHEPFICWSAPGPQSRASTSAHAVVDQAKDRCIEAIRPRTGQDDHNQHDRI